MLMISVPLRIFDGTKLIMCVLLAKNRTKSLIRKISLILANATVENLLFSVATAKMFRQLCTKLTSGQIIFGEGLFSISGEK